jgi:hypothetical protein
MHGGDRNFISGQYRNAVRVVIADAVLDQAYETDDTLSEDTKRFIDRHVTASEKRPPAPSVGAGTDQAIRKKA